MLPELEQLLVIQDRDQKILNLKSDLERLPKEEENAKLRLVGDRTSKEKIEQEIKENEVGIKSLELDIETRRDTISKLKVYVRLTSYITPKHPESQTFHLS